VLHEEQLAGRLEHPPDLCHHPVWLLDAAQHERRHDRVEGAGLVWKVLGARLDDLDRLDRSRGVQRFPQTPCHVGIRLGEHEVGDPGRVVPEVEAGAGADLQRAPEGRSQKRRPHVAQASFLICGQEPVIERREYRVARHDSVSAPV
jgi:hypothetical protein